MRIAFVAGFSPIVRDPSASLTFYRSGLGLTFEGRQGDYTFTEQLGGVKHLGLWPLREAAQACFGKPDWPDDIPVPQANIEFEVESVEAVDAAGSEVIQRGCKLGAPAPTQPRAPTLARLPSPAGLRVHG